ncbi:MAG: PDZ domain-containing protein [Vicinamibacterales bacterium]
MAKYFARVANDVEPSVAYARRAQVSGIVWDEGRLVTSPIADSNAPLAFSVTTSSTEVDGHPAIWGPNLPLAAVGIDQKFLLTPVRRATSLPQSGEWVLAVWRTGLTSTFAAGNFRQTVSTDCGTTPVDEVVSSLVLVEAMRGGGLFDIDGQLVGMMLPCGARMIVVAAASIQRILTGANTIEQRVRGSYGLGLEPLSPEEQDYFGTTKGLLVREVWTGLAGDSLRAGDVVMAVDGVDLMTPENLRAMTTSSDAPVELSILRASKRLTVALPRIGIETEPRATPAGAGVTLESPRTEYHIGTVRPDSPAARAGLLAGDRVVRIDQAEPRSLDQVNRRLSDDKRLPVWFEVHRGGRRWGTLVR